MIASYVNYTHGCQTLVTIYIVNLKPKYVSTYVFYTIFFKEASSKIRILNIENSLSFYCFIL